MEYSKRKGFIALLCLVAFIKPVFAISPIVNQLPEGLVMVEENTLVAPNSPLNAPEPRVSASMVAKPVNEDIMGLIRKYNWDWESAYKVMFCESSGNSNAVGDSNTKYFSYGLFQIRALPGRPSTEWLKVPENNVEYAFKLWNETKTFGKHWVNCSKKHGIR